MSSLDQILGRLIIPIYHRQEQTIEQQYPILKSIDYLTQNRKKWWNKKVIEFENFDIDKKEKIYKNLNKIFSDPQLLYGWHQQWWNMKNKKRFNKFKWLYPNDII
jgi:hypothetical protein